MKKIDRLILIITLFTVGFASYLYTSQFFKIIGYLYGFSLLISTALAFPWLFFIFLIHEFVTKTSLFQLIESKSIIIGVIFEFIIHALIHLLLYLIIPIILIMGYKESFSITDSFYFYLSILS